MRKQNLDLEPNRLMSTDAKSIAVLRALQLGDLLCAVPALRALRSAFPGARISLVGLPWSKTLVQRFDRYLDEWIEFPGYPGLPERPVDLKKIPAFLARMQERQFDLAIQMHGSGSIVNPLVSLWGARVTAGYFLPGEYCPDPAYFMPYPEGEPEPRRHLRLMEFLGVPQQGEDLEFPLKPEDVQEARSLGELEGLLPGDYVCVHPGARADSRRWPPEQFALVADALAGRGLRIVLTGSREEAPLTHSVAEAMHAPALDLAGRTSLGALGLLLKESRLLVSNDTGVSHVASALDVPSVVVFSASDPTRWAPLDRDLHRIVDGRVQDYRAAIAEADALLAREAARV